MVSDFLVEGNGYLKYDNGAARFYLETQKDGYFNNDMFIQQVKRLLPYLTENFPAKLPYFNFIMHQAIRNTRLMVLVLTT